jgi:hypothetical protein
MNRLVFVAATLAVAVPAAAQEMPKMKAGLWETVTTSAGPKGAAAHTSKTSMCINEAVQKEMMSIGQNMGAKCSKSNMRRDGNKYYGDTECSMGQMTVKSTSVTAFSGDSSYRGETRATFSPPMGGMSESNSTTDGKYVGPCPANMKPGDVNMGGRISNISDMAKMMKGMPK